MSESAIYGIEIMVFVFIWFIGVKVTLNLVDDYVQKAIIKWRKKPVTKRGNEGLKKLDKVIEQNESIVKALEIIAKQSRVANRLKATDEYYKNNICEGAYNQIMDAE